MAKIADKISVELAALRAKVKAGDELLRFAGHLGGCADPFTELSDVRLKCDCGYADALAAYIALAQGATKEGKGEVIDTTL